MFNAFHVVINSPRLLLSAHPASLSLRLAFCLGAQAARQVAPWAKMTTYECRRGCPSYLMRFQRDGQ
jgi:hypothetical protein